MDDTPKLYIFSQRERIFRCEMINR